jgi:hypothetical protein
MVCISWARRAVLFAALFVAVGCESGEERIQGVLVASPSGDVQLRVTTDTEGHMMYTVTQDGELVIESSPLGLMASTHNLTAGVTMTSVSSRAVDETYAMPTGKRRERHVSGNAITVP